MTKIIDRALEEKYAKCPVSSTDNAILRWDGATGRLLQDSSVYIDDSGNLGVGLGVYTQIGKLHIRNSGAIFSEKMTLGSTAGIYSAFTGNGDWGLYIGQEDTGKTWIQGGRTDSAVAYDISLQASGGKIGIGTTTPSQLLELGGTNAQIYLNSATSNMLFLNSNGVSAPSFTTRSVGTKIVLYPSLSGSIVDFAIGVDTSTLWQSIGNTDHFFKWYSGTSVIATLAGNGTFTFTNSILPSQSGTLGIGSSSKYWSTLYCGGISTCSDVIELNQGGSGNRNAYIDFHGDDTYTDYGLRIIRNNDGANASAYIYHRGTWVFCVEIMDAGYFYVKTNSNNRFSIDPYGYAYFYSLNTTSSTTGYGYIMQNTSTGEIRRYTSSERYKKNIIDLETDTTRIYNLRPVSFEPKEESEKDEYGHDKQLIRKEIGLIAEEVNNILPELVYYDKNNIPEGVHYNNLSILMLSEVKKINDRLKELEAKVYGTE